MSTTQAPVKVIIVGNSGVGKSFLANVVLGDTVFKHAYQGGSCTSEVERETCVGEFTNGKKPARAHVEIEA